MKVIVALFLTAFVAVTMAEYCRQDSDCDHETCSGDGWAVNCHFGTCTCDHSDHTGNRCSGSADCTGRCPGSQGQHCVDEHCRCLRN